MPFQDIVEQEHIFALLDELASQQNQQAKTDFRNPNYVLMRRLWILSITIHDYEKDHGFDPNKTSYQRAVVNYLIDKLESSDRADKLAAALPEIKELLYKAWAIDLEIVCGRMKPLADVGEARKKQVAEWGKKGVAARIENSGYTVIEKNKWLDEAKRVMQKNPALSVRALTAAVIKNLMLAASERTVRAYLSKFLVKPSVLPTKTK